MIGSRGGVSCFTNTQQKGEEKKKPVGGYLERGNCTRRE